MGAGKVVKNDALMDESSYYEGDLAGNDHDDGSHVLRSMMFQILCKNRYILMKICWYMLFLSQMLCKIHMW